LQQQARPDHGEDDEESCGCQCGDIGPWQWYRKDNGDVAPPMRGAKRWIGALRRGSSADLVTPIAGRGIVAAAGPFPAGYDVAPIWQRTDVSLDIERDDISGLPQGIDPTGNSIVDSNWIHGLVQNGDGHGGPTHLDGIFIQGGGYYTLRNQTAVWLAVVHNTFGGANNALNEAPGTVGAWAGDVHVGGAVVPRP
jgi:hypothetical protein